VLFILLAGGVLSVARMLWAGNSRRVMGNVWVVLRQMLPGSAGTFNIAAHSADRMPYGVAMAAGLLAYGVWIFSGRNPIVMF
jgi:Flp pilus assembly protein protease CpaA